MKKNFVLILFFCLPLIVYSQINVVGKIIIDGKIAKITYRFDGESDSEYELKIKVKKVSDNSFELDPQKLSGDYGIGKYANSDRTIFWEPSEDEISRIGDNEISIVFICTKIESKKGISPWYFIGGGAIVAGVAAAIIFGGKKSDNNGDPTAGFPVPPGRP